MKLGVPMEPAGETRVAIAPSSMKKLLKAGFEVFVESGAGKALIILILITNLQEQPSEHALTLLHAQTSSASDSLVLKAFNKVPT